MITFYPRDIGMWRKEFDFSRRYGPITLECKTETDHKVFYNRNDFIDYLKEHGVKLDDPNNSLLITGPHTNEMLGPDTYDVVQWSLLGWIKDDYI